MQFGKLKSDKKTSKNFVDQNPIEAMRSIRDEVKASIADDLGKATVNDAWDQLLGVSVDRKQAHNGGDLTPGQELTLSKVSERAHELTEMGHEFVREIVHSGENASAENTREVQVKIQEVLIEIKQLANSTKDLQAEVEVISVEQTTKSAGTYHVNFLEGMISWLRDIRMNVEDSLAWFGALRSKKKARQYGVLAKKHGTSFTLSNERTNATQTG